MGESESGKISAMMNQNGIALPTTNFGGVASRMLFRYSELRREKGEKLGKDRLSYLIAKYTYSESRADVLTKVRQTARQPQAFIPKIILVYTLTKE